LLGRAFSSVIKSWCRGCTSLPSPRVEVLDAGVHG
jgi:hypothetical protein